MISAHGMGVRAGMVALILKIRICLVGQKVILSANAMRVSMNALLALLVNQEIGGLISGMPWSA